MTKTPKLPAAARKAVEQARKLAAANNGDPAEPVTEGQGEQTPEPVVVEQMTPEVSETPAPAAPEPAAMRPTEPAAPEVTPERIDPENYKERWKTLKVFHDKEATRFHQTEKAWAEEKADLTAEVANLKTQNAALVRETAQLKIDLERASSVQGNTSVNSVDFSDEELAALGDDGAKMVASIVNRQLAEKQAAVQAPPEPAPEVQAAPQVTKEAQTRFFRGLSGMLPNWEKIQAMPGFTAFWNSLNPATGATRSIELETCLQTGDYVTAASIYQEFLSANRASAQATQPDELVMPDGNRGSELPESPPQFNVAEFSQVKRDIGQLEAKIGSNRHKPQDVVALKNLRTREEELTRALKQAQQR